MAVTIRNSLVGSKMFSFSGSLVFFSRPRISFFFQNFQTKMNVSLTMEVAITHVVYVSIHLEATAAHVNRDMNSKRTGNSSVKVRNSCIFVPCTIVIFWLPTFHFVLQQSNYFFKKMVNGNGLAASNWEYHRLSSSSLDALNIAYFECDFLSFPFSHFLPPAKLETFSSV